MNIAVILSGCGYLDGAEIHESVLCLLALAQKKHEYQCFAPNKAQAKVIDHLSQKEQEGQERNVLVESARIARGEIKDLSSLNSQNFDGVLMPGGFGAALNLSSFAQDQEACSVDPECRRALLSFYRESKPIGATCIAPAVLGKVFEETVSLIMTLGKSSEANAHLENMGMQAQPAGVQDVVVDEKNKVFTTPAYMEPADLSGMFEGIRKVVDKMEEASQTMRQR